MLMKAFPAPKLNLGLNVKAKRPDGYHELETLFVPVDIFSDVLEMVEAPALQVEIPGADWPVQEDLTVKAWRLLSDEFGIPPVRIYLEKHIPAGAGLGGGSSDAASALKLLNALFSLGLSDAALAARAAVLGSDCAFFIYNTPMFATGRGEVLEPYALDLSRFSIAVEIPEGERVSTREAYAGIAPAPAPVPLREALSRPVACWKDCVFNDFEKTVFAAHPRIGALKEEMYRRGAVYAAMSGSGAAVFGLFAA
ncbi:MAG: 4-(cytidine 5'-diphospho)-2-C-methyl-D-erythritol kinase [Bacteroidales bacterium]|nr:4-(cytidine 5'-diphospho)-2-C-methyl-D-erythritol kinase [Bacteroidales bacterium]